MSLIRHNLIWMFACGALLGGCMIPQINGEPSKRDARRDDGFERVIHVDEHGNVDRGPEKQPRPDSAATSTPRPAPRRARLPDDPFRPTPTDEPLSEQTDRFYEELASLKANDGAPAPATPNDIAQPAPQRATATPMLPRTSQIPNPKSQIPTGIDPTIVHSKRFTLEYNDELLGPEGIARVELYGTRDNGGTWERLGEDRDRRSPYDVEMEEDGLYGFRIAVAGKNGLASRAPDDGELPELWVQVNSDAPAFHGNLRASDGQAFIADAEATDNEQRASSQSPVKEHPQRHQASNVGASDNKVRPASHDAPTDQSNDSDHWREQLLRAIDAVEIELAGQGRGVDASDSGDDMSDDKNNTQQPLTDDQRAKLAAKLRMLYLAIDQHDDAIRSSGHHSTQQNEYWSHQLHGLHLLLHGDDKLPPARQSAAALAELRHASDKLAAVSELQISSLTFCTAAHSFGVFETTIAGERWKHNDYRQAKFEPEQPVVLYFEVGNFASEQHTSREYPDGAWKTSLKGSYTILDNNGRPLERREMKLREDICRNRRHDYFVAYKTWMPKLNPGRYTLELLIEDAIAGKIGTSTIDFEIVAR